VIDTTSGDHSPAPFKKLIVRYLALAGPIALVSILESYDLTIVDPSKTSAVIMWSLIGILYFGFYLVCLVQIITKRDPLYDRIAGTAVVREIATTT
jgi:uncharacterized RDD family membrane protein YckC